MKRKSQFPFVSSAALIVGICGVLISNQVHYAKAKSLSSRLSDILRHGPLSNHDSAQRRSSSSSLLLSPFRYFTDVLTDSEATESQNAGTVANYPNNAFQAPSLLTSSFSPPVTYTSQVQLPQFTQVHSLPNKETYGYTTSSTTSFPIHNPSINPNTLQNLQPPVTPVLLQPIVQYIIQLQNPYGRKNIHGHGQQGQNKIVAEETVLGSTHLSKEIMEMMNEASKDMAGDSIATSASEQQTQNQPTEPSTDKKIHLDSIDNLISVIEHMNNVSDATIIENDSSQQESSMNNQNLQNENNNNIISPGGGYQNFLGNQNGDNRAGGYSLGNQISPPVMKQSENSGYDYYPSSRNDVRNGFFNSPMKTFQPHPKDTADAMTIFSHLSDQISRDLYSDHLSKIQYGYNAKEDSAKGYNNNNEANSRGGTVDPVYGDSSVYYTSYSNQRPPLDSEIYHTLKTILRNKK